MGSVSEFQIVGAAKENDLQPYFFNFADGIVRSLLEADLRFSMVCRVAKFLLYSKVLTHALITLTFPCLAPHVTL